MATWSDYDPNVQKGTDAYGNPVNGFGLPLGQTPQSAQAPPTPGAPPPPPEDPSIAERAWRKGTGWIGDLGSGAADLLTGNNAYRPQTGAPSISAQPITAAQMQAAGMNTQQADADLQFGLDARRQQQTLGDAIMARALGQGGPSVAELQMQRGIGLASKAAAQQAASARGIGRGLAAYGAANAQANLAAQGVQDASALRAQEQIAAQGLAQKGLTDQRMQDLTSRGMSIQQAQAIMDAENRAREANMGATNQARQSNQQSALTAAQANLQADTALRGMTTQITEGESTRKQKAGGGLTAAFGSVMPSDIRAKQDVRPLLYSQELGGANAPEPAGPSVQEQTRQMDQDRMLGQALARPAPAMAPIQAPASLPIYGQEENPYDAIVQQQAARSGAGGGEEGGGLNLGQIAAIGSVLSDKRAKTDAFVEGVKAALMPAAAAPEGGMLKASLTSAPVFELTPGRVKRGGHATLQGAFDDQRQRQALADAFAYMGAAQEAAPSIRNQVSVPQPVAPPAPPPVQVAPVQPTQTSDKRAKRYGYSDERAKELAGENAQLKAALARMGNEVSGQIRGDTGRNEGLGAALTRMGRDADVSGMPTASYPDVSADAARSANPPPGSVYRYKPEFAEKQGTDTEPRLGFMAQDALKSPFYRPAVVEMPDGMLGIDQNRLIHANTAMLSGEHERLNQVEQQNAQLADALSRMGNERSREIRSIR